MCLETTQKRAKIAKEDIHCYKIMVVKNTHIKSVYQEYRYYINKLETISKFGVRKYNWGTIEINEGLHAFLIIDKPKRLAYLYNGVIYNCIIPKGSKYYIGNDDDIVSNQMIITGRYKEKK